MESQFSDFKVKNPEYAHLQLFRTFERNPLKFWNWYSYFNDEKYKYEYKRKVNADPAKSIEIKEAEAYLIEENSKQ